MSLASMIPRQGLTLSWRGELVKRHYGAGREGHAEARDAAAVGGSVHGLEFLFGGLEGRFQGDLAEPVFAAGFGDAGLEVVTDLLQPGFLGWVKPELRVPDAAVFMNTGAEVPDTDA